MLTGRRFLRGGCIDGAPRHHDPGSEDISAENWLIKASSVPTSRVAASMVSVS